MDIILNARSDIVRKDAQNLIQTALSKRIRNYSDVIFSPSGKIRFHDPTAKLWTNGFRLISENGRNDVIQNELC